MKNPFEQLDKVLEHRVRLQIMSVLVTHEGFEFNAMKDLLSITDGNLASQMKALEKEKYVSINKSFVDKKPNTKYKSTEKGRNAFKKHIDALEAVIKQQR